MVRPIRHELHWEQPMKSIESAESAHRPARSVPAREPGSGRERGESHYDQDRCTVSAVRQRLTGGGSNLRMNATRPEMSNRRVTLLGRRTTPVTSSGHLHKDCRAHKIATVHRRCASGRFARSRRSHQHSAPSPRAKADRRRTNRHHPA